MLVENLLDVLGDSCSGYLTGEVLENGARYRRKEIDVSWGVKAGGEIACYGLNICRGGLAKVLRKACPSAQSPPQSVITSRHVR